MREGDDGIDAGSAGTGSQQSGDRMHGGERSERAALDPMLSAALDDELPAEERERLAALVARDPELARRARALEAVDESLRALAAASVDEARVAGGLAALESRLAEARSAQGIGGHPASAARRGAWRPSSARRVGAGLAAAVVALLLAYWMWPGAESPISREQVPAPALEASLPEPPSPPASRTLPTSGLEPELEKQSPALAADAPRSSGRATTRPDASDEASEEASEEEMLGWALALGLADEPPSSSAYSSEDLEVIEQLDLLEYLAARETEGRG
jgi:hypothetical protein